MQSLLSLLSHSHEWLSRSFAPATSSTLSTLLSPLTSALKSSTVLTSLASTIPNSSPSSLALPTRLTRPTTFSTVVLRRRTRLKLGKPILPTTFGPSSSSSAPALPITPSSSIFHGSYHVSATLLRLARRATSSLRLPSPFATATSPGPSALSVTAATSSFLSTPWATNNRKTTSPPRPSPRSSRSLELHTLLVSSSRSSRARSTATPSRSNFLYQPATILKKKNNKIIKKLID